MDFYHKTTCRLCDSTDLSLVLSLTPTPPGNHFVTAENRNKPQPVYPLALNMCEACKHVQLTHCVDPVILYQTNYSYVSGTSPVFVAHLREYADTITADYAFSAGALAIDIGSNDGTALGFFKDKGFRTLGVDPATEVVASANARGIETICDFFGYDVAARNREQYGPAALINSHNACAHIDDLAGVIRGVEHWLGDDGLFVMEVGYFLDVYENGWFDTIYHEHVDYHTVMPLVPFFRAHGLEIVDVQHVSPQGGSIRVIAQKAGGRHPVKPTVEAFGQLERDHGLDRSETLRAFGAKIDGIKHRLGEMVSTLKGQGASIAAFGAPTKATTLLSHFGLGQALDFLVDDNPLKQNLFSPGHHIPVLPATALYERKPDYLIILAWNFAEDIMRKHAAFLEQGGKFILPMPEPVIIDKESNAEAGTDRRSTS
ncbi:MAG: class I SAM-dependent methyltransferase [Gemmatimonadota bacterium]